MANLSYDGNIVNSAVSDLNSIYTEWDSVISDISISSNKLVDCRGFEKYIGGISKNSFSDMLVDCQSKNRDLINNIRDIQVEIIAYSSDENDINAFLNGLTKEEYQLYNQKLSSSLINAHDKSGSILKSFGSSLATLGLGLVEGFASVFENIYDVAVLTTGALSCAVFLPYYALTGDERVIQAIHQTKAIVAEKNIESLFDRFYNNTSLGQKISSNAYAFDNIRKISRGAGYMAGVFATGSFVSNNINKFVNVTAPLIMVKDVENAWADGDSVVGGLAYGSLTSIWSGYKSVVCSIAKRTGVIGSASGIFRKAVNKTVTNVVETSVDCIVDPLFKSTYKDYGDAGYAEAFQEEGGLANIGNQIILEEVSSGASFVRAIAKN